MILFENFLKDPSGENFKATRAELMKTPGYDFFSNEIAALDELAVDEDFHGILKRAAAMIPAWLLSPSLHLYLSEAFHEAGDRKHAEKEEQAAKACLRGMSKSGDGSKERPYLVMHEADEYDLIEAMGKEDEEHTRLSSHVPPLDKIRCEDGSEYYFEIGTPKNKR